MRICTDKEEIGSLPGPAFLLVEDLVYGWGLKPAQDGPPSEISSYFIHAKGA